LFKQSILLQSCESFYSCESLHHFNIAILHYCTISFTIHYFIFSYHNSFYRKTSCDSSDNCAKLYYKNEFLEYVCNSGHHRTNCISYNSGRVMVIVYLYRRFTSSIFIKIILCILRYGNGWTNIIIQLYLMK